MTYRDAALPALTTWRRRWAALAVVALVWAQCLGVWHHTVHAPGLAALHARAAAAGTVFVPATATVADGFSSPLHHTAESADCRLLDQLLLADGAAAPLPACVLPAPAPAAVSRAVLVVVALFQAQPYLARAPPAAS